MIEPPNLLVLEEPEIGKLHDELPLIFNQKCTQYPND
jgi:hypothetical protein